MKSSTEKKWDKWLSRFISVVILCWLAMLGLGAIFPAVDCFNNHGTTWVNKEEGDTALKITKDYHCNCDTVKYFHIKEQFIEIK